MTPLLNYFDQFQNGDTTVPKKTALLPLAQVLDAATESVVIDLMNVLRASNEHQARIALLNNQPTTAGKFSRLKILLQDASSFEQMAAISEWLAQRRIRTIHTFFLSAKNDDYVPVQVKKKPRRDATPMNVVLGSTSGDRKAPKYKQWALSDPWDDPKQAVFIRPLEALEIVRQPNFSAATVIKGNAFEQEHIDQRWRYGAKYACVEGPGQAKNAPKKVRSSGLNACALAAELSNADDPRAEETNICEPVNYENYVDDGYLDNLNIDVTPGALIQAAQATIENRDDAELRRLMENLTIAKLDVPRTPMLCDHIAQILRRNNAD